MGNAYITELKRKFVTQAGDTEIINTNIILNQKTWEETAAPVLDEILSDGLINFETAEVQTEELVSLIETKSGIVSNAFFINSLFDNREAWGSIYYKYNVEKNLSDNILITMLSKWLKHQSTFWERLIIDRIKKLPEKLTSVQLNALWNGLKGASYWKASSVLNGAEASVWGSLQAMQRSGVQRYQIKAIRDRATCPVCLRYDGTTYAVQEAVDHLTKKADTLPEELSELFPFPREADLDQYDDITESPFTLCPFHSFCRCQILKI